MSQESAARCLDFGDRPSTPHEIRKFRKSYFSEPGSRVTHPGAIDDDERLRQKLAEESERHERDGGRKLFEYENRKRVADRRGRLQPNPVYLENGNTQSTRGYCATLDGVFQDTAHGSFAEYLKGRNESIYRSHQREPLGKPYTRGHTQPKNAERSNQSHAKQSAQSSTAAKNLIYALEQNESKTAEEKVAEAELEKKLYTKSHGSYGPGEQKLRNYKWNGIDPHQHRFGSNIGKSNSSSKQESVAACLQPGTGEYGNLSNTVLTNRTVEVFKQHTSDPLGKPKPRGFATEISKRVVKEEEWSAEKCIQGDYTLEEQMPDEDLGKAMRVGWRNQTKSDQDADRIFGCPTVRTDIPMPVRCSVGDSQNYGDDTNAEMLLYPTRFSNIGVGDEDFVAPMEKEDLAKLFRGIGHDLTDDDVDRVFSRASSVTDFTPAGKASIHDFRIALNEKLDADDAGLPPPTWW